MKLSWGTGIIIAFVAFTGFILFFVVRMSTDERANHDLVTEEYYRAELDYQNEIDAADNARRNALQIRVEKTPLGLGITFPGNLDPENIFGKVSLYRPSDKLLDFDESLRLTEHFLLIPDKRLQAGRWDIKISWEYNGQKYLHKEKINY